MLRSRLRLTGATMSEDNKVQKQIGLCKPCVPLSTEGICSSLYYILKSLALQRKIRALPVFLLSYRYEKRRYAPPFRIFSIILMVSVFAVLRFFVLLALLRPLTILILLTYTFFSFYWILSCSIPPRKLFCAVRVLNIIGKIRLFTLLQPASTRRKNLFKKIKILG